MRIVKILEHLWVAFIAVYILSAPLPTNIFPASEKLMKFYNTIGFRSGWGFWGMFKNPSPYTNQVYVLTSDKSNLIIEQAEVCKPSFLPDITLEFCQRYLWPSSCNTYKKLFLSNFCNKTSIHAERLFLSKTLIHAQASQAIVNKTIEDQCFVSCN